MKIKLMALIAGILLISVGFSTLASAGSPLTITEINATKQGIVYASVKNTGSDTIQKICVKVSITYGLMKRTMDFGSNGITLSSGMGLQVSTLRPLTGMGRISITAEVCHIVGEGVQIFDDSETVDGFIFFHRIIFSNQEYPW
jgi:hypothetical protein